MSDSENESQCEYEYESEYESESEYDETYFIIRYPNLIISIDAISVTQSRIYRKVY